MAPAEPGFESRAKQVSISSAPSGPQWPPGPTLPTPWNSGSHQQSRPWAQRFATAKLLQTPHQSPLMPSTNALHLMFTSTLTKELWHPFLEQISRSC